MSEDQEIMLVRTLGGDVIRRPVAYVTDMRDINGRRVGAPMRDPELGDDEEVLHMLGDPIPLIIKTR